MHGMARAALGALALAAALSFVAPTAPAGAHEEEEVGGLHMVVGWGDEPSHAGFKNSVQVVLTDDAGDAITDTGDLHVEVSFGDQTVSLPLQPNFVSGGFGEPGDYRAWITPTRPGTYTFRLLGTVAGQAIDQSFTSGPDTFDDVAEPAAIQFPVVDPTAGELAERIEREAARSTEAISALEARAAAAEKEAGEAKDDVASARTMALIALVAGGLGVVVGGVSLLRRRA